MPRPDSNDLETPLSDENRIKKPPFKNDCLCAFCIFCISLSVVGGCSFMITKMYSFEDGSL